MLPGATLTVYRHPRLAAPVMGYLQNGSVIQILCTAQGDTVVGNNGQTSSLWNGINGGFVPDVFIYTGTDQATMPNCPP
ncbi:hypothetical protein DP939_09150 [Spongiactinospora rosea]|uniref:SH3 domain-containing protein n=1 Tax=Spongiactinospora rosea TaxID=2248750 RepID=A0A366M3I3_9ACTN|nr:hypothetical protein DP939_09150 [Spongiactinospora rosea]